MHVARRFEASTGKAIRTVQEELLEPDTDEEEEEEEQLPPWRQLKPWRWEQPETDPGIFRIFQLPAVEQDEAGRSYIIGMFVAGVFIFFSFVWWGPPEARAAFRFKSE
mmetsp:Transcript_35829/g.63547  ORF Transcript_35829/g.63547 Transcript_35829/m.63547 type:complete len:108 (+) Transcript_35829:93-416(+)